MIEGIFETHINVKDYEQSVLFYKQLPGLELFYTNEERKTAFFWVGGKGNGMLGIRENYPSNLVQRQHFAIKTDVDTLLTIKAELIAQNIPVTNFYNDDIDDLYVFTFMPAVSFYITDPDGHSVEYLAMLPDSKVEFEEEIMLWQDYQQLLHLSEL